MINQSIKNLNQVFTDVILDKCKDKKVLLTLSGGMDTRAILSILLHNKIPFDAITCGLSNDVDIKIAKRIAKDFKLHHIIVPFSCSSEKTHIEFKKVFKKYDVVLDGTLMSGLFDKYEHFDISEANIEIHFNHYANYMRNVWEKEHPNVFTPAIEQYVLDVLKHIPIYYRLFSYPQVCMIKLNEPKLVKYPHTSYNLKKRIGLYCHRVIIWLMGVVGYE